MDNYLVVAYVQRGVSKMVLQRNKESMNDFNNALKYLRSNEYIDYTQIGLDHKVYSCEVLYNRALCYFCLGQKRDAQMDLANASQRTMEKKHSLIKKAVESSGLDCPLFCVPKGIIYRPSASKLKSTKKIDFLGSAKVIASADGKDNFTGFKGALVRKETLRATNANANSSLVAPMTPTGNIVQHQKSMRVARTSTPPPQGALARANTLPINRPDNSEAAAEVHQPNSFSQTQSRNISGSSGSVGMRRDILARLEGGGPNGPPAGPKRMQSSPSFNGNNHRYAQEEDVEIQPDTPDIQIQMSADSDTENLLTDTSSAFTSPEPPLSGYSESDIESPIAGRNPGHVAGPRPGGGGGGVPRSNTTNGAPSSGGNGGGGRAPVDPLDIIRAGLARRTTLKKQQQQQQTGPSPPIQRSETVKTPRHINEGGGGMSLDSQRRAAVGSESPSPSMNSRGTPPVAQMARTEVIAPAIRRSNTASDRNRPQHHQQQPTLSPDYYGNPEPTMMSSSYDSRSGGAGSRRYQPPNNNASTAMMASPPDEIQPLSHGMGGMHIQQSYGGLVSHGHQPSVSSNATSPSPSVVSPGSGGGIRRVPTKKDAMKVKVHYGQDVINLMIPKMSSYNTLRSKLATKISAASDQGEVRPEALRIRYLDEDGEAVLMTDEDDFELAKAYAGGDMSTPETNVVERLELWCVVS